LRSVDDAADVGPEEEEDQAKEEEETMNMSDDKINNKKKTKKHLPMNSFKYIHCYSFPHLNQIKIFPYFP
jgi:hypothetical protein